MIYKTIFAIRKQLMMLKMSAKYLVKKKKQHTNKPIYVHIYKSINKKYFVNIVNKTIKSTKGTHYYRYTKYVYFFFPIHKLNCPSEFVFYIKFELI